jgi:hypothetical protein
VLWIFQSALLGAALGSLPGSFSASRPVSIVIGAVAGTLCGAVITLGVLPWLQRRAMRQTRGLAGSFEAQLDRQGLSIRAQDGREMTRHWSDLGRLAPDREHLFIYWKDGQVTLLPRRAFMEEGGEEEIRALIQGKGRTPGRTSGKRRGGRDNETGIGLRLARTPEDLALFAWHQNLHDPALRLRTWFSYAVLTGMTIYLSASVLPWWGAVLSAWAVAMALPRLYFGLLKRQGATMLRQAGHREVEIRLDQDGVTESTGGSAAKVRWGDVERIEETPKLVLIYVDRLQAVVIPRRYLGTDDEARDRLKQIMDWHAAERDRPVGVKAKR